MKVLHVVPSFGLGGMEKVLCSVLNVLPEAYDQEILSLNGGHEAATWIQRNDVQFIEFTRPSGNGQFFLALLNVLKRSSPDLLMTYNWGATDAIWLGRLAGISTILHNEHGFNVDEAKSTQWKRDAVRYLVYRMATRIIVVSEDLKQMMLSRFALNPDRVMFIPNGVNTDYYTPNFYEREKGRTELGLQDSDIVVGYSGRLDPVKNFPFLLEVFSQCVTQDPRFKLLLIGDGPERKLIEAGIAERGLHDKIIITGRKTHILPYIRALDIFLLTSFREQMPMSMLEAMSVGVPIVASAVGEIPAMLQGQDAGLYFPLDQGAGPFVHSLLALRDLEKRNQMGESARTLVLKRFPENTMIRNYIDLLSGVMRGPEVATV